MTNAHDRPRINPASWVRYEIPGPAHTGPRPNSCRVGGESSPWADATSTGPADACPMDQPDGTVISSPETTKAAVTPVPQGPVTSSDRVPLLAWVIAAVFLVSTMANGVIIPKHSVRARPPATP